MLWCGKNIRVICRKCLVKCRKNVFKNKNQISVSNPKVVQISTNLILIFKLFIKIKF